MPGLYPPILPGRLGGTSRLVAGRAMQFGSTSLQLQTDKASARVSLNQASREKAQEAVDDVTSIGRERRSKRASSSVFQRSESRHGSVTDVSRDEARDRLRCSYIKRMMRQKRKAKSASKAAIYTDK